MAWIRMIGSSAPIIHNVTGFLKDTTQANATYDGTTYNFNSGDYGFIIPDILVARYLDGYNWRLVFNFNGTIVWSDGTTATFTAGTPLTKYVGSAGMSFVATPT